MVYDGILKDDRSNVPESVVFKMFADLEQSKKDIHFDGFEIL
jgi:hypothetical protein